MKESVFGLMLQVIKHIFYIIQRLINVISRPTHSNRSQELLEGYIYIVEDKLLGTIHIGSSISQNKIEEIKQTYYRSKKYKLQIVYRTHSTSHKQRREVLSELQDYYYNIYNENQIGRAHV